MIRRSFHPLVVTSLAVLALAGCSDADTPTAVTPTATPPRRASPTIDISSSVTYPILNGTIRLYDTQIVSVNDVLQPAGTLDVFVPAGAKLRLTGKWQIGPITNEGECPACSYSVYVSWGDLSVYGAAPLNEALVTMTSPEPNPNLGASGTFDWTTYAPHLNAGIPIGVGQSIGRPFADDESEKRAGWVGDEPGPAIVYSFLVVVKGPTISPAVVWGTLGNNGWYTSDVTVSWEVADVPGDLRATGTSGCDPGTIASDVTKKTLTCSVTSSIGTATRSVTINRDASKPTIAFNGVTPAANAAGWRNKDVTATWTCSDEISGVATATASQTVATDGADQSATGNCVDKAGNSATDTRGGINLDKTPPTLAPQVVPSVVALNGSVTASPNAGDALSGVVGTPSCGPVPTNLAGTFTVSCTATDKAGNTATKTTTYTVTYAFGGFVSPVSAPPTLNSKNAGSAVPVSFSLGGNQGLAILAAGSPTSKAITCPAGATVSTISDAPTSTSGNSVLTYDAKTNLYSFNWKTEKSWAGTCRTLTVTLADGTEHTANFQFKK